MLLSVNRTEAFIFQLFQFNTRRAGISMFINRASSELVLEGYQTEK